MRNRVTSQDARVEQARSLARSQRRLLINLGLIMTSFGSSLASNRLFAKDETLAREFPVSPFNGVSIRFPGDFELTQSTQEGVLVTAEPKVLAALRIAVKDNVLILDAGNFQSNKSVKVRIQAKSLQSLRVTSSGDIVVKNFAAQRLSVESDASASITLIGLLYDQVKLTVKGSETIKLSGRTKLLELRADGSSDIDASNLEAQSVIATLSGASSATVKSIDDLRATASDSSTLKYRGGGRITKRVTDAAEVTRLN